MARPKLVIDEKLIERLAEIHCTMSEIAAVIGCSVDTLERRFADTIKSSREKGKTSLRRWQWRAAENGNTSMQIWLGKNILGQTDSRTIEVSATQVSEPLTLDERIKLTLAVKEGSKG